MKYIRTKDGRIIKLRFSFMDDPGLWVSGGKENILKTAYTIEGLCDGFVIKIKTSYLITYYDKKLLAQDANKNGADVYGAIWTEWGLKYVAKMNDKGELELL